MKYFIEDNYELIINVIIILLIVGLSIKPLINIRDAFIEEYQKSIEAENAIITETVKLASLSLSSTIEGDYESIFTLGRGFINEKFYYYAYKINQDGSKSLYEMDAKITKIYDSLEKNELAHAEVIKNGHGTIKEIKLYVPVGTIQQEYNLELNWKI